MESDTHCVTGIAENRRAIDRYESTEMSALLDSLHALPRGRSHVKMDHEARHRFVDTGNAEIPPGLDSHARSGSKAAAVSI